MLFNSFSYSVVARREMPMHLVLAVLRQQHEWIFSNATLARGSDQLRRAYQIAAKSNARHAPRIAYATQEALNCKVFLMHRSNRGASKHGETHLVNISTLYRKNARIWNQFQGNSCNLKASVRACVIIACQRRVIKERNLICKRISIIIYTVFHFKCWNI